MPPDLPNEQELNLKKRARRRLVGAIGLVLLMVIVLPRVLQDRAALAPQEAIKIIMPAMDGAKEVATFSDEATAVKVAANQVHDSAASQLPMPSEVSKLSEPSRAEVSINQELAVAAKPEDQKDLGGNKNSVSDNKTEAEKSPVKVEKKVEVKSKDVKPSESKTTEPKPVDSKISEAKLAEPKVNKQKAGETKALETKTQQKKSDSFSVQVGVYSDANNVKQLQSKLKEIGYSTHTEKLATPKGEKIRLKAGSFTTRQDAVQAQAKIQKIGLSGMVVSN